MRGNKLIIDRCIGLCIPFLSLDIHNIFEDLLMLVILTDLPFEVDFFKFFCKNLKMNLSTCRGEKTGWHFYLILYFLSVFFFFSRD